MSGIKDILGIAIGAILAVGIMIVLNFLWFFPEQQKIGREVYVAEQLVIDKKNELSRKNDDEKIRGLSDYDVCVNYVGKLPECEALKLLRLQP